VGGHRVLHRSHGAIRRGYPGQRRQLLLGAHRTDDEPSNLTTAVPAVTATQIAGDNAEVTWDPTLSIIVPAGAAGGTYTLTITHSVS
jgi:hypothetical protein